ncbi:MAG: hypothetical protein ACHP7D_09195 [Lysobacterales bacterium]
MFEPGLARLGGELAGQQQIADEPLQSFGIVEERRAILFWNGLRKCIDVGQRDDRASLFRDDRAGSRLSSQRHR